jgi:hypothetical protein
VSNIYIRVTANCACSVTSGSEHRHDLADMKPIIATLLMECTVQKADLNHIGSQFNRYQG